MISKAILTKGFVALSASSAVGTGALKFFSTKDLSERVNEELKRRFKGKTNEEVLSGAGFKINKDESSIAEVLKKRSGNKDVSSDLSSKLASFCREGLGVLFAGIDEVYKTLATVCTEEVSIKNKVRRVGMTLTSDEGFIEKLEELNRKEGYRKFISDITVKDVEHLRDACERVGAEDIFSAGIDQTVLSDYMTFCVEEKPSVIKFWTGTGDVVEVEEMDRIKREAYLVEIKESANKTKKDYETTVSKDLKSYVDSIYLRYDRIAAKGKVRETIFEVWNKGVTEEEIKTRLSKHEVAMDKLVRAPISEEKAIKYWQRAKIAGIVLSGDRNRLSLYEHNNQMFSAGCGLFVESDFVKAGKNLNILHQLGTFCAFKENVFALKMKGLKERILTEDDAEVLRDRWSKIVSNDYLKRQSGRKGSKVHEMFTTQKRYSEEEAKRLIGECSNFSLAFGDLFEFSLKRDILQKTWEAYTLVCADNHDSLSKRDFWSNSLKN